MSFSMTSLLGCRGEIKGMGQQGEALWERAEKVLAGGPATLSKHPSRFPQGIAPVFLERGEGAYCWDVDGRRYIDTIAALGPILLGHAHPGVTEAVQRQSAQLTSASLPTRLEVEVAERLAAIIPGAEQVRFASNGKDVTEAAVKVARYVTGKQHVIYVGYHGGFGDYLATTDKDGGLLSSLKTYNTQIRWGDTHALDSAVVRTDHAQPFDNLAAIIVEVPPEPRDTPCETTALMIHQYSNAAKQYGALFILDEVVTGFRYGLGGAQALYGVQADLACFSKGMANGYKLAAITGPRHVMQAFDGGRVFLSTTFGGEATALAACKATLDVLQQTPALSQLHWYGSGVGNNLAGLLAKYAIPARLRGNYARMVLDWQAVPGIATADELRTLWLQELLRQGVLASVPIFPMCCYTADIVQELCLAFEAACSVLAQVIHEQRPIGDVLECPVITDVFQQRYAPQEHAQ